MVLMRCGLIGAGIGSSLSPALHEAEGRAHGLDLAYTLIDVDEPGTPHDLRTLLGHAEAAGLAGVNVTHPFKQQVVELLDELSPQARDIGAVNTVVFRDGRRVGDNTDAYGFAQAFRRGLPGAAVDRVVQLGAGGAGAACAFAQLALGVRHLAVIDPDQERRGLLAEALSARFEIDRIAVAPPDQLPDLLAEADGLVNTTPVGMATQPGLPLPIGLLRPGLWVADIVYMPVETALLRAADRLGLRTLGGTAMCVYQAAAAFELFTGLEPDTARMFDHLTRLLHDLGGVR
jgi:shikimate dehydrogenase